VTSPCAVIGSSYVRLLPLSMLTLSPRSDARHCVATEETRRLRCWEYVQCCRRNGARLNMCIQLEYPRKQKLKIWKAFCCLETHFTLNPKTMIQRPHATLGSMSLSASLSAWWNTEQWKQGEWSEASFIFGEFRVRISTERQANLAGVLRCFNQSIRANKC
jgi:hypothetical protein